MVNLFQERAQDPKQGSTLVGIHGSTVFSTPRDGEVRGMRTVGGLLYAVVGPSLYQINAAGTASWLADIGSASGRVSITDNGVVNGQQIIIADGSKLKIWDLSTSALTTTTSEDADVVGFVDGYIVYPHKDSGQFYYSAIYDASDLPALNFSTAEGSPDNLVSLVVDRREVWLLGEKTTEVWYNQGNVDNIFARFQGGFSQMGCAAPHSVTRFDNAVAWLGRNEMGDAVPVISRQYAPEYLTGKHPQVAYQIAQYKTVDDCFAYSYRFEGHEFLVFTFPTENITWCYDASEGEWHQRAHIINDVFPNRERYNCHAFAFGKHLVGDYENGQIYEISSDVYTIDGTIIPNVRTTTGMKDKDEDRIHVRSVELTGESGMGGNVALTYSKDGGHTYSNERVKSFGDVGKYATRLIWRKFSSSRDWILRFTRKHDGKTVYTGLVAKEHGEQIS